MVSNACTFRNLQWCICEQHYTARLLTAHIKYHSQMKLSFMKLWIVRIHQRAAGIWHSEWCLSSHISRPKYTITIVVNGSKQCRRQRTNKSCIGCSIRKAGKEVSVCCPGCLRNILSSSMFGKTQLLKTVWEKNSKVSCQTISTRSSRWVVTQWRCPNLLEMNQMRDTGDRWSADNFRHIYLNFKMQLGTGAIHPENWTITAITAVVTTSAAATTAAAIVHRSVNSSDVVDSDIEILPKKRRKTNQWNILFDQLICRYMEVFGVEEISEHETKLLKLSLELNDDNIVKTIESMLGFV